MSITFKTRITKPESAHFFKDGDPTNFLAFKELYSDYPVTTEVVNINSNVFETTHIWESKEAYNEYLNDTVMQSYREIYKKYNSDNGIVLEVI